VIDMWEFVSQADRRVLQTVFSRQRPELLGAVLSAAGERTAIRIRRKLGPRQVMPPAPTRPMHPTVADRVRATLQEEFMEARRNQ